MKLFEFKKIEGEYNLLEGVIPFHVSMPLAWILRDGGITNNVQYFILGAMVEFLKNKGSHRWPREMMAYEMCTNDELLTTLKTTAPEQIVTLTQFVLDRLNTIGEYEAHPLCCMPRATTQEWINLVHQHQK